MSPAEVEAMPDNLYDAFVRFANREIAEQRRANRPRRR
jgi:hypothetical protein